VLVVACTVQPRTEEMLAGCYAITRNTWQGMEYALDDTLVHDPPAVLHLLVAGSDTLLGPRRRRVVAPGFRPEWIPDSMERYVPDAVRDYEQFSSWALKDSDTLEVHWTDGLVGVWLRMVPRGQSWHGIARPISDVIGGPASSARASVIARAVPCPAGTAGQPP
jgi:hypothetical protein